MCVTSLLCGPRADLWPFYGFLCKRFSLYINVGHFSEAARLIVERWRHGLRLKLITLGVGDSLLLPLTSIPEKENNGSKRLSPTPSVSNLSLRPCRYLSTVCCMALDVTQQSADARRCSYFELGLPVPGRGDGVVFRRTIGFIFK